MTIYKSHSGGETQHAGVVGTWSNVVKGSTPESEMWHAWIDVVNESYNIELCICSLRAEQPIVIRIIDNQCKHHTLQFTIDAAIFLSPMGLLH